MHKYYCHYLNNCSIILAKKFFFLNYFSESTGSVCWENVGQDPTIKKKSWKNIKNCKTSTESLLCCNSLKISELSKYRSLCHDGVCLSGMKTGMLFLVLTSYHQRSAKCCSGCECSVYFPAFRNAAGEYLFHQKQYKNVFQILSNALYVGEIWKATPKLIQCIRPIKHS